jgi:hypothetical protein
LTHSLLQELYNNIKTLTDYIESDASGNIGIGAVDINDPAAKLDLYSGSLRLGGLGECTGKLYTDSNGVIQCGVETGADNLGNHIATQDLDMQSNRIVGVAPPKDNTDAATKEYVDAAGSGAAMYETSCAWRYDWREGKVDIGAATNWGCNPPACASGYTSLTVRHEPASVSCGGGLCHFDVGQLSSVHTVVNHPVVVGASFRVCAPN